MYDSIWRRLVYKITKRFEISGSHNLSLSYPSKCQQTHGHNWIIEITCQFFGDNSGSSSPPSSTVSLYFQNTNYYSRS